MFKLNHIIAAFDCTTGTPLLNDAAIEEIARGGTVLLVLQHKQYAIYSKRHVEMCYLSDGVHESLYEFIGLRIQLFLLEKEQQRVQTGLYRFEPQGVMVPPVDLATLVVGDTVVFLDGSSAIVATIRTSGDYYHLSLRLLSEDWCDRSYTQKGYYCYGKIRHHDIVKILKKV